MTRNRRRPKVRLRKAPAITAQQQARQLAETWLQALRAWKVVHVQVPAAYSSPDSGRFRLVGVAISTGYAGTVSAPRLQVPHGFVSEHEVGREVTLMARSASGAIAARGRLLERVRAGGGPATLLDGRSACTWRSPESREYAVALLTLALQLGDLRASDALAHLMKVTG